uniref:GYF domain-containing protein n=1 Tax=Prevotella sp. GTC17259 TaxID=3236795 RepID=A0AB33J7J5_9BACT
MTQYFIIVDNQQQGPYTLAQLQDMHIGQETLVWSAELTQWTPAWQVEELKPLFNLSSATAVPPPIPAQAIPTPEDEPSHPEATGQSQPAHQAASKQRSHWRGFVFLGIAIILGILAITNPSREDHNAAIQQAVKEVLNTQQYDSDEDIFSQGMEIISGLITRHMTSAIVDQMLEVDNYGIFSIGTIHLNGKSHTISYGILGHVYTFDKTDVKQALEKHGLTPEDASEDGSEASPDQQAL